MNDKLIITLLNIPKVSRKTVNSLLKTTKIYSLDEQEILRTFVNVRKVNKRIIVPTLESINTALKKADKILNESKEQGIGIITMLDKGFPLKLKEIEHSPNILYYKGDIKCIYENKSIAIVGTRNVTSHSIRIANRLGSVFGKENFIVISGLAKGCDEFAHKGCIEVCGRSIAVLPGGIDNVYPESNKNLARDIIKNGGCLVSEYPVGVKPSKNTFVERDRIQSALSSAILVVSTGVVGGTMHTVDFACKQGKIVACYEPKDNFSNEAGMSGNIKLIEEGVAISISDTNDISSLMKRIELNALDNKECISANEERMIQVSWL
ncbi:DNA-processing protein DprA [Clostridium paridis]|uniref:DNA-protecting protein DprA n=1 Tax=Clostridium paridis TaxID=2803863 RepID=A0A937FCT6_9CLOT|nr:DNA-processing protein DprA [Clostridium paridis]MBL4930430.1 DNA-protecting protein DprA [Clostridium paridis]